MKLIPFVVSGSGLPKPEEIPFQESTFVVAI
jgi:hypothetical protein